MATLENAGDLPAKNADRPNTQSESPLHQSALAGTPPGSGPGSVDSRADTAQEVQAGTLPSLTIEGQQAAPSNSHWWSGAAAVGKDLVTGAYNEVTEHPLQVAASAVIGAGIGLGAMVAGPEVAIAAGVAGAAYAGYELYEHGGAWAHDAKVVANSTDFPQADVAQAHANLQDVGAGGAVVAARMAGGALGGYAGGALASAIEATAADTTAGAMAPSVAAEAPAAVAGADVPATFAGTQPGASAPALVTGDYLSNAPRPQVQPASADSPALPPQGSPAPAEAAPAEAGTAAQAFKPFTAGDATFTQSPGSTLAEQVEKSGNDRYASAVLSFANRWATLMEKSMADGQPLTKSIVDTASHQADTEGLAGYMVYQASQVLGQDWKYGSQLPPFVLNPVVDIQL